MPLPASAYESTPESSEFHMDKCVSQWMSVMGNSDSCVAYVSGMNRDNPEMEQVTAHDLRSACDIHSRNFMMSDAVALCGAIQPATSEFWASHTAKLATVTKGAANGNEGGSLPVAPPGDPALGIVPVPVETSITADMGSMTGSGSLTASPPGETAVLLGASWCGWTNKQVAEIEGMSNVEVVMCDLKEDARCERANAFPTWVVNGEARPGFIPRAEIPALLGA
jgi:hypothetical protein